MAYDLKTIDLVREGMSGWTVTPMLVGSPKDPDSRIRCIVRDGNGWTVASVLWAGNTPQAEFATTHLAFLLATAPAMLEQLKGIVGAIEGLPDIESEPSIAAHIQASRKIIDDASQTIIG